MNRIRIRKIVHNSHCEFLGEFSCPDIIHFFRMYSGIWMAEHTDENGTIQDDEICKLIDSTDEFNILEKDYFIIGFPITHMYEGIYKKCDSVFIMKPDEFGFETIVDNQGNNLIYKYAAKSNF